jgi:hypothetical protein
MLPQNRRSQSERIFKLPKLSPSAKIGPTTQLSPPHMMSNFTDLYTKQLTILDSNEQKKHPEQIPGFLDGLIKRYSSFQQNESTDFSSNVQRRKETRFVWSCKQTYGTIPGSRVGGTLTIMGQNELYLFGGQRGDRLNELKYLRYDSLRWSTVTTSKELEMPEPRDGHTTLAYKHYLVVYGGAGGFNTVLHTRTCSPLLHLLDTHSLQWKIHKPLGRLPDPRRNHSAVVVGNTMLIYGGIGSDHTTLSDFQGVNLENMQWFTPKFTKETLRLGSRHSFSMTPVFHSTILKNFLNEIYNVPTLVDEEFTRKNSGIYIFGGMNADGKVLNDLYLVQPVKKYSKTDKNLLKGLKIEGTGKPPIPRYYHSAALCGKYLVIVGGRNDSLFATSHQSNVNEVAAFNVVNWVWETVEVEGEVPMSCWGMASAAFGTKLLCFGGMNLNSFATNDLWVMETSQDIFDGIEFKKKESTIRIVIKRNSKIGMF